MCGIAGAVFWNEPGSEPEAVVRAMTDAQAHRGPDGAGVERVSGVEPRQPVAVFGHRRLAIIDLTERAAQPMRSSDGLLALTFNGEIYNFKQIRRELESFGRRFRSDSDGEVILQGYDQWGADIVPRLRGMFAFALWDGRCDALLLVRDRIGIKPLYVLRSADAVLFASEVRAVLASGMSPRRLDRVAVAQYLRSQTVATPRTLVEGIELVEPGCVIRLQHRRQHQTRYWDLLSSARPEKQTTDDAQGELAAILGEATALHLVSDVPVGVFLSSGIDSTAVAALVARAGVQPQTFTVSFPGSALDEGAAARDIARRLGASHTDIPLSASDCAGAVEGALAAIDHPSGDGINTFIVSGAVRGAGVKVALSGLGGDELFGGYPSFRRMRQVARLARAWRWSPPGVRRIAAAATRKIGGSSPSVGKVAALLETNGGLPTAYPLFRELFSAERRAQLMPRDAVIGDEEPYAALLRAAVTDHPAAGLMTLVSYAEARTYMHDVLLRDTDQMSMRHGLEVRVPLLDHRVMEYVMALPDRVKHATAAPKGLLVDSVNDDVLSSVAAQPKQGFVLPFDVWMRGELRGLCEDHLGPRGLGGTGVFSNAGIQAVWHSFLDGTGETWSRPWALVAFHAWMQNAGIRT
jgi:asparagine synthase (glutamine-hydrolysing)